MYQPQTLIPSFADLKISTLNRKSLYCAFAQHYQAINPTTKVIDFKQFIEAGMGAWWRDSRGVSNFEQLKTLILCGTPCRNLADMQAEYAVLAGV